jgi:hypothetical protein
MNSYLHPYPASLYTPTSSASHHDHLTAAALRNGLTGRHKAHRTLGQRLRSSFAAFFSTIGDRRIPTNPAPTASYYELAFHRSRGANAR